MMMKFIISVLSIFCVKLVISQITIQYDTVVSHNSETKYEFERWNNSHKKKLKSGKGIKIEMKEGDSTHVIYGRLYEVTDNSISIVPSWERIKVDTNEFHYSKITNNFVNSLATIATKNINSIRHDAKYVMIPFSIGFLSMISATVVAPLVSIDKNSPNNFNSKRYKSIVLPSLIGVGAGFSLGYILGGGKNRFKLKPTLVNTEH